MKLNQDELLISALHSSRHRCTGGNVLGASESISRPTSIQDRQQTFHIFSLVLLLKNVNIVEN